MLVPVTILAAAAWVAFLAFQNVRERRSEIGILRALGMRGSGVLAIILAKAALTGLVGAVVGFLGGSFSVGRFAGTAPTLALVLILSPVLSALAAWVPALVASRQDPAVTLSEA